jgi:hypothetical protein
MTPATTVSPRIRPDAPLVGGAFVLAAAVLTAAAGSAGGAADPVAALGDTGGSLLRVWFGLALALAVVLPAGVLLRWGGDPVVRRALLPYLGVLAVQVATEAVVPRLLPPWTVLVSGGLYTGFRLWQLRTARSDLAAASGGPGRRAAAAVVTAGTVFWTLNLLVLAASAAAVARAG